MFVYNPRLLLCGIRGHILIVERNQKNVLLLQKAKPF
jgi:hypothetical protein